MKKQIFNQFRGVTIEGEITEGYTADFSCTLLLKLSCNTSIDGFAEADTEEKAIMKAHENLENKLLFFERNMLKEIIRHEDKLILCKIQQREVEKFIKNTNGK